MHLSLFITFLALNKLVLGSFPKLVFSNFISCRKVSYFLVRKIRAYLMSVHRDMLTERSFHTLAVFALLNSHISQSHC